MRTNSYITHYSSVSIDRELSPLLAQLRFINGEFESFSEREKAEFLKWVQGLPVEQRDELIRFAAVTISKGDRKKIAALNAILDLT